MTTHCLSSAQFLPHACTPWLHSCCGSSKQRLLRLFYLVKVKWWWEKCSCRKTITSRSNQYNVNQVDTQSSQWWQRRRDHRCARWHTNWKLTSSLRKKKVRENQKPEIQKKTEAAGQRDAQVQRLFQAEWEEKRGESSTTERKLSAEWERSRESEGCWRAGGARNY